MGKDGNGDIVVKVFRAGGKGQEVALNGKRTVQDALNAAGLTIKDHEIVNVNGSEVDDLSQELKNHDRVVLVKNIEGGLK